MFPQTKNEFQNISFTFCSTTKNEINITQRNSGQNNIEQKKQFNWIWNPSRVLRMRSEQKAQKETISSIREMNEYTIYNNLHNNGFCVAPFENETSKSASTITFVNPTQNKYFISPPIHTSQKWKQLLNSINKVWACSLCVWKRLKVYSVSAVNWIHAFNSSISGRGGVDNNLSMYYTHIRTGCCTTTLSKNVARTHHTDQQIGK